MNDDGEIKDLFGACPYVTVQKIFSGKYGILIIHFLSERSYRFGELQRELPSITQATLTKQLKYLEKYQMVHREVYREIPPKVEYSLTEMGQNFIPVLQAFQQFGEKYIETMKEQSACGISTSPLPQS